MKDTDKEPRKSWKTEAKRLRSVMESVESSLLLAASDPRTNWPVHARNEVSVIKSALAK